MDSTLRSTSTVVFNRLVIFVLKEADQIFRQLLGVSTDAELASGAVKRQPRCAISLLICQALASRAALCDCTVQRSEQGTSLPLNSCDTQTGACTGGTKSSHC